MENKSSLKLYLKSNWLLLTILEIAALISSIVGYIFNPIRRAYNYTLGNILLALAIVLTFVTVAIIFFLTRNTIKKLNKNCSYEKISFFLPLTALILNGLIITICLFVAKRFYPNEQIFVIGLNGILFLVFYYLIFFASNFAFCKFLKK